MRYFIFIFLAFIYSGLWAQASYEVTITEDSGQGSLRQAIILANIAEQPAEISFNIPGPGPHVIKLNDQLPPLTTRVGINGFSQPGGSKIYPQIILDCNETSHGFIRFEESLESSIRGIIISTSPEMLAYEISSAGHK